MGSKGEKKSGLVGEKSHSVYSANWKLDTMLEKELSMLDTSKHRVEHRIAMDQVVANKRFQVKLHRSKIFHARMKDDKEMLKKLITRDNYDFHTKSSSVDVLNKQREKDLEKKRILHRASQEKMMMYRDATPAATPMTTGILNLTGAAGSQISTNDTKGKHTLPTKIIRPMTAIERITSAKLLVSGKVGKARPSTAIGRSNLSSVSFPSAVIPVAPLNITGASSKMKAIPELKASREARETSTINATESKRDNGVSNVTKTKPVNRNTAPEIVIEISQVDDDLNESKLDQRSEIKTEANIENKNKTESTDQPPKEDVSNSRHTTQTDAECNDQHPSVEPITNDNNENENYETVTSNVPMKSSLRPTTAPNDSSKSKSDFLTPSQLSRPRSSVSISEPIRSDNSDDELVASTCRRPSNSPSRAGSRKSSSSKSRRRKSAFNIFEEKKKLTIMDIDEARRQRANHTVRINDYVNTLDDIKTDPDLIVDYYMARLLEESSISGTQKNVKRIRDMPDSDYDLDLAKRSLGNLGTNMITFRDVNKNYNEYKHDPYSPLHPTSMGYGLASRASTMNSQLNTHDSHLAMPNNAWQIDEGSDADTD